jgi:hypothetical protein
MPQFTSSRTIILETKGQNDERSNSNHPGV